MTLRRKLRASATPFIVSFLLGSAGLATVAPAPAGADDVVEVHVGDADTLAEYLDADALDAVVDLSSSTVDSVLGSLPVGTPAEEVHRFVVGGATSVFVLDVGITDNVADLVGREVPLGAGPTVTLYQSHAELVGGVVEMTSSTTNEWTREARFEIAAAGPECTACGVISGATNLIPCNLPLVGCLIGNGIGNWVGGEICGAGFCGFPSHAGIAEAGPVSCLPGGCYLFAELVNNGKSLSSLSDELGWAYVATAWPWCGQGPQLEHGERFYASRTPVSSSSGHAVYQWFHATSCTSFVQCASRAAYTYINASWSNGDYDYVNYLVPFAKPIEPGSVCVGRV